MDQRLPRTLTRERYISADFAEREWENVWATNWLLLNHTNALEEAGDFFVEQVGRESIMAARQHDGSVKCFYNLCQHRGNQLVTTSEGSVDVFTCGYHGWRWALDGACAHAQDGENFAFDPCKKLRLAEVRSEVFGGFVWINMDPDAMPLKDFLGPIHAFWEAYPSHLYRRISGTSVRMPCNWKTAMDNFHESYHVAAAHPIGLGWMEDHYRFTHTTEFGNGHSLSINFGSVMSSRLPEGTPLGQQVAQDLQEWDLDPADFVGRERETRLALQQQKRKLAHAKGRAYYDRLSDDQLTDPHHITLFPNSALTFNADGMLLLRATPDGDDPGRCILDTWFYSSAPGSFWAKMLTSGADDTGIGDVPRLLVDYEDAVLGPVLQDDAWVLAAQQRGFRSRGYAGAVLAGQENRIAQYHAMLDHCMAGGGPEPLAAQQSAQVNA